jgi:hypothetical protein
MAEFLRSLYRFSRRALSDIPSAIGSNKLGVLFPFIPAILVFGITFARQGWMAMKWDWIIAAVVTAASYLLLFIYCVVRNLYREHMAIVEKAKRFERELDFIRNTPPWAGYESEQVWRSGIDEQNRLVNLGHSVDGYFTALQTDALQLSTNLLKFLQQLGPAPTLKYTADDIRNMPPVRSRALVESNDADYAKACEVHFGEDHPISNGSDFYLTAEGLHRGIMARYKMMDPWDERLKAAYALGDFGKKVEVLRHRFIVEGLDDDVLQLPITGRDGEKNVRAIAGKLWELSYKIGEKNGTQTA